MMKKLLYTILLFVVISPVSAQNKFPNQDYLGINFGYGTSGVMFQPNIKAQSVLGSYAGGLAYKHRGEKYIGFEANLNYVNRGYKVKSTNLDTTTTRTYSSIMLPIMAQGTIGYKRLVVIIDLGTYASYMLSSKIKKEVGTESTKEDYDFILAKDRRYEFGVLAGAGFYVDLHPFLIQIDARYYYGLTNIINPKYVNNKPLESRPYQLLVSAGIFYDLGSIFKKGPTLTKN